MVGLATGCVSQRYDVRLTNGAVVRSVIKPRLNKDGFYFVKDESGKSGTINKVLVREIAPVSVKDSKSDTEFAKSAATEKSAKPSGKANFRNSFEFR